MTLIDRIQKHTRHVADLTYGPCERKAGYQFRVVPTDGLPLTEDRGVYFLLSDNLTQIQKVGKANGIGGLRQRMSDYEDGRQGAELQKPTPALWHRVMMNQLQGNTLSLWFFSFSQPATINALGQDYDVLLDPHDDLERQFQGEAKAEGHHPLLSQRV